MNLLKVFSYEAIAASLLWWYSRSAAATTIGCRQGAAQNGIPLIQLHCVLLSLLDKRFQTAVVVL